MDSSYLWNVNIDTSTLGRFESPTLLFQIASTTGNINHFHHSLSLYLKPFVDHYPFYFDIPKWSIGKHDKYEYIYGEQPYGDNVNDEWLLIYLLWQFTSLHEDIYIHVSDSLDGEVLFVEGYEALGNSIDPKTGANRPWIHRGEIVLVSKFNDLALSFKESCDEVLLDKVDPHEKLTAYFIDMFNKDVKNYNLETVFDFEVELPEHILKKITTHPSSISRSISLSTSQFELLDKESISNIKLPTRNNNQTSGIVSLQLLSVSEVIKTLQELEKHGLTFSFKSVLEFTILFGNNITNSEGESHDKIHTLEHSPRNELINKLISAGRLKHHVNSDSQFLEKVLSYDPSDETEKEGIQMQEDELISRLESFFTDQTAGLDGIDNAFESEDSDSSSVALSDKEADQKTHNLLNDLKETLGDEFSDFIDYCVEKEASISDKKGSNKRKITTKIVKDYNDDSDYNSETSVEYDREENSPDISQDNFMSVLDTLKNDEDFKEFLNENKVNDMSELIQSVNASSTGPGSIFLDQALNHKK